MKLFLSVDESSPTRLTDQRHANQSIGIHVTSYIGGVPYTIGKSLIFLAYSRA